VTAVRAQKLAVVVIVAAAAGILLLTAWGSSDSSDSQASSSDTEQAALDFTQCLRDNGVPNAASSARSISSRRACRRRWRAATRS
jgi:hypothetical protein